jgi:2-phosphoglycerate kinase
LAARTSWPSGSSRDLEERSEDSVELDRFEELAVEVLGEADGSRAIGRLRRFRELQRLDLPVIVLVGGATGTGKSTVATEAAYRLGITRVTSTDFVRQTMRRSSRRSSCRRSTTRPSRRQRACANRSRRMTR